MSIHRPRLQLLTPAATETIHSYSLHILAEVGIRVDSPTAAKLFAEATGTPPSAEGKVKIPPELVNWALEAAPSEVLISDRNRNPAIDLQGGNQNQTRFGIGVTNLYYQEPEDDRLVPFQRAHMALAARLAENLPQFDLISTPGICQDVHPEQTDLIGTLELAANTRKPLVLLVNDDRALPLVLDLLEELCGPLAPHPWAVVYCNPITPLVLNQGTVNKMETAITRGLPIIFSNYGMAGATTPVTPTGTLALLNAELLAGLTLSQLIRKGAPVILGSLPAAFEMRTMGNLYTPHSMLLNLAGAEMMAHYRLPHAGTSGCGTGWGPDLRASDMLWMNHLSSCLGKVGLAPFVGGNLESVAFCPALVVYANEIIRQARLFAAGFPVDAAEIDLEEIAQVGPGGDFLGASSTVARFREFQPAHPFWPHLGMEQWQERGRPRAEDLLRAYTMELLQSAAPPPDRDDILARGEEIIHSRLLSAMSGGAKQM